MKNSPCFGIAVLFLTLVLDVLALEVSVSPQQLVVSTGGAVSLRALVSNGQSPFTYAWSFAGERIDPAVNSSANSRFLTLKRLEVEDGGVYAVTVTDGTGAVATASVELEVNTTFSKNLDDIVVTNKEESTSACWIDYDLAGDLDLYVANAVIHNQDSLYRNNGDGTFTKVGEPEFPTVSRDTWGITWGDVDNDGLPDLFTAGRENRMDSFFYNNGDGVLALVTGNGLSSVWADSVMPLWVDYDADGLLDLFVSTGYWSGSQVDMLFHNEGNGDFSRVTGSEYEDMLGQKTTCVAVAVMDYDSNGRQDIFAAYGSNITGLSTNYVFRGLLDGTFEKVALPVLDTASGVWGAAVGDYNNDGYDDLFLPRYNGVNGLFRNLQGAGFEDVSATAGLDQNLNSLTATFVDYDNDGWLDLVVGNYGRGNAVFHNRGDGTFERVYIGSFDYDAERTVAVAAGDYDNNGFTDLYFANGDGQGQANCLYRNNGNENHWLDVKLDSTVGNRMGVGAKVRVLANIGGEPIWQMREITAAQSWVSGCGLTAHFGLGDATVVEQLRVEWPSGTSQILENVVADQILTLTEPRRPELSAIGSGADLELSFQTEPGRI